MAQATVASRISITGNGLHSGTGASLEIIPAGTDQGIVFERTDVPGRDGRIEANYRNVQSTRLCTTIGNEEGVAVQTVEHLMASMSACGISNATVRIDGPEVPAVDGSALPFARQILQAGVDWQDAPRKVVRVLREIRVEDREGSETWASLSPADGFEMDVTIEFPEPVGKQCKSLCLANGAIARNLGNSRTFCAKNDIEWMQARGFGLGGNYENVVVIDFDHDRYLNKPRHADECVRHKMLDAVGDLSLAGMPILGRFTGNRSGHTTNCQLLQALFSDQANYVILVADDSISASLPGVKLSLSDLQQAH